MVYSPLLPSSGRIDMRWCCLQVGAGHAKAFIRKHEGWAGEDAYFCTTNE